jgi:hypothetical protein
MSDIYGPSIPCTLGDEVGRGRINLISMRPKFEPITTGFNGFGGFSGSSYRNDSSVYKQNYERVFMKIHFFGDPLGTKTLKI